MFIYITDKNCQYKIKNTSCDIITNFLLSTFFMFVIFPFPYLFAVISYFAEYNIKYTQYNIKYLL